MDDRYREARRRALEARGLVEELDRGGLVALPKLEVELPALEARARELDAMVAQQDPTRQQVWMVKLGQLDQEIRDLRAAVDGHKRAAKSANSEAQMRAELMSRRSVAGEAAIDFSHEEEARVLNRADSAIDNIFLSGKDTLESLYMQRSRLKGTQKRMLDFANQIGVSRDLIRKIERKENANLYIIGLAFIIIIIFMLLVSFVIRRR